jgi:hypothetical protein
MGTGQGRGTSATSGARHGSSAAAQEERLAGLALTWKNDQAYTGNWERTLSL